MPAASVLRSLATARPDEARALILRALKASKGDRTAAALLLRASAHLPPGGTDARSRVTLAEIVAALGMGEQIRELYGEEDAKRAIARAGVARAAQVDTTTTVVTVGKIAGKTAASNAEVGRAVARGERVTVVSPRGVVKKGAST